jgi:hypothetical protein
MMNDSDVSAPIEAALERDYERQSEEWQRVASELRSLADEHGEGFVVSDDALAALTALEELTTMDTVPAELPPMARMTIVKG